MDRIYLNLHLWGAPARQWRRPGLVALLTLLAAGSTTLWLSKPTRFQPYHFAVALPTGSVVHLAAWQPGPVYIPSHINPATVLGRPTIMLWLQGVPAGTMTQLGRIELPAWPPMMLTLSLTLAALSIGLWPRPFVRPPRTVGGSERGVHQ